MHTSCIICILLLARSFRSDPLLVLRSRSRVRRWRACSSTRSRGQRMGSGQPGGWAGGWRAYSWGWVTLFWDFEWLCSEEGIVVNNFDILSLLHFRLDFSPFIFDLWMIPYASAISDIASAILVMLPQINHCYYVEEKVLNWTSLRTYDLGSSRIFREVARQFRYLNGFLGIRNWGVTVGLFKQMHARGRIDTRHHSLYCCPDCL